ncbi:GNAT family N-acetyltransferase [Aquincola sp. S2]|uniref:GNAT family N-acetyltransferase n=1 Tax=Pseudaquabacterium terrae TaxID=2732868 RepID=A0ABX2EEG3_9BURK|nr:GNAT family N-acetyltransferase [Aquabacterium terrae]NRF66994.1 GNAT family N-acetyltransferase [Aquabacterium terrae]
MHERTPQIREAAFPADSLGLRSIIQDYVDWLDMELSERFIAETAALEQLFSAPSGLFLVAEAEREIAGCVGLLRHSDAVAEVKRLFVRPAYRGAALGERLVASLMDRARSLGYARLVLNTVPRTRAAQVLYQRFGFTETAPYYEAPVEGMQFFEMALKRG